MNLHITSSSNLSGIKVIRGNVRLENVIIDNMTGEAILVSPGAKVTIKNATIIWNNIGIKSYSEHLYVKNSIICYNNLAFDCTSEPACSYNCVSNNVRNFASNHGLSSTNISSPPVFIVPVELNKYLIDPISPTVDVGDPLDATGSELDPNGGRINIGAYGGTLYAASKGLPPFSISELSTLNLGGNGGARPSFTTSGFNSHRCYIFTPILHTTQLRTLNDFKTKILKKQFLAKISINCYVNSSPNLSSQLIKSKILKPICDSEIALYIIISISIVVGLAFRYRTRPI
jgi:hypothetical protein